MVREIYVGNINENMVMKFLDLQKKGIGSGIEEE